MSKQKPTIVNFLDKNDELAEEYEKSVGEDLWSLPIAAVDDMVSDLAQKIKVGFNSILNNCINHAIETQTPLLDVLDGFNKVDSLGLDTNTSLQKYFKEINKIYTDNNNDYDIPFCRENRDKIIGMNLKSVIAIAKGYQGLGIDFQDLISAGNEGLCKAFEKYDPKRACLKENILEAIDPLSNVVSYQELSEIMSKFLKYGDVKKMFEKQFKVDKEYTKKEIKKWVDQKINNAKFNSVACKWIKAYIINEINVNSRTVKKPKSEIDKDKIETGSYKKEVKIDIDAPVDDENKNAISNILVINDDSCSGELERDENYKLFKQGLNKLLTGVKSRDRRIVLKKFGIGLVRPMLPNEIAVQEDLSVARISQIINATIQQMIENKKKYEVDEDIMIEALRKIYDN